MKKELIDLITPIILDIQEKKKAVTDQVVAEFMRPRRLHCGRKSSKGKELTAEQLTALNNHLEERSYLVGHELSSADEAVVSAYECRLVTADSFPHLRRWRRHVEALLDQGLKAKKLSKDVLEETMQRLGQCSRAALSLSTVVCSCMQLYCIRPTYLPIQGASNNSPMTSTH